MCALELLIVIIKSHVFIRLAIPSISLKLSMLCELKIFLFIEISKSLISFLTSEN